MASNASGSVFRAQHKKVESIPPPFYHLYLPWYNQTPTTIKQPQVQVGLKPKAFSMAKHTNHQAMETGQSSIHFRQSLMCVVGWCQHCYTQQFSMCWDWTHAVWYVADLIGKNSTVLSTLIFTFNHSGNGAWPVKCLSEDVNLVLYIGVREGLAKEGN